MKQKAKRIYYLDLLRILAIFLVVLLHNSRLPQNISFITTPSFVIHALAMSCVPLFVMVSGALLLGKVEGYKLFFKKRFSRIFFPWIIWSTVFFFIDKSHSPFVVLMTRFWFLPLIVGLYFLTPVFRLVVAKARLVDLYYFVGLWFIFLISFPYLRPTNTFLIGPGGSLFAQVIQYSGYFFLGYLLSIIKRTTAPLTVGYLFILFGIFGAIFSTVILSPGGKDYLKYFEYLSPFIVLTSSGVFILFKEIFKNTKAHKDIVQVGSDAAFGIVFVHELFNLFLWHNSGSPLVIISNLPYAGFDFIRALLSFSLALVVVIGIRKIKVLKNIVI